MLNIQVLRPLGADIGDAPVRLRSPCQPAVTAEDFTVSVASGLRPDDDPSGRPVVTFEVDHWRTPHDDDAPSTLS